MSTKIVFVVALVALWGVFVPVAFADAPTYLDWMYAMPKCTGMTLPQVQQDYQRFVTQWGFDHGAPVGGTPAGDAWWTANYDVIVASYTAPFGCNPRAPIDEDTQTLNPWWLHYSGVYRTVYGPHGVLP